MEEEDEDEDAFSFVRKESGGKSWGTPLKLYALRTVKPAISTAIEYWNIDVGHALIFTILYKLQDVMTVVIEEGSIS